MGRQTIKRNYDNEGKLISKECACCNEVKPVSEFYKHKPASDGLRPRCKECLKKYKQDNAESIKEYKKQYRKNNAEKIKEYSKEYQKNNAEKIKEYYKNNAEYYKEYQKNKAEKIKEYNKEYYKNKVEYYKEYNKEYRKNNAEYCKECNKKYNTKKVEKALQQIKTEVEKEPEKYNYIEGKEIYGIIYLVHNIESDRYYVGQTVNSFDIRYQSGWLYSHSYKDTVKEDLTLYGKESFKFTKIFKVAHSQYELDKLEAYYIDYYNSYENGYNENRGNVFSDRGKEK